MNTPKDPYDPAVEPIQAGSDKSGQAKQRDNQSRSSQQSGQQHAQQSQKKSAQGSDSGNKNSDSRQQATKSPQQQASPTADRLEGKWDQFVGAAKTTWGKLTDDEILQSEGNSQKLAGLVQERYAVSRDIADTQVKKFLESCRTK